MSDYDEDIMGLIRKPEAQHIPSARYISKFRRSVKLAEARGKSAHKTLGVPNVQLHPPTEFLRRGSRPEHRRNDVKHKHYHIPGYQHKLPPWEKIKKSNDSTNDPEKGQRGRSSTRDFKKQNIITVKNSQPKKPRMYYADDRRGNSSALIPSGLHPLYRDRKSSTQSTKGKERMDKKKNETGEKKTLRVGKESKRTEKEDEINKEENETEELKVTEEEEKMRKEKGKAGEGKLSPSVKESKMPDKTQTEEKKGGKSSKASAKSPQGKATPGKREKQPMCRYVTEEERVELLYGMKKKWDEMMQKFQVLPFLTDTPPKAKRKAQMEEDLKQLEKDIELIERNPHIYVYEGNE